jgi:hypothetical protein
MTIRMHHAKTYFLIIFWICLVTSVSGQAQQGSGFTPSQEAAAAAWLKDLYTHGVQQVGDSIFFNDETRRIVTDSAYRKLIYPQTYTWNIVQALLQRKILKPAIWHLINLYHMDQANHEMVLKVILPLDQTLEMDRVLLAAFYTYLPFDPEVYHIENGQTVYVKRPDIAEQKLLATRAMAEQVFAQRSQANVNKQ